MQLTVAWLLPMTAACALALAVAVAVRSAIAGAGPALAPGSSSCSPTARPTGPPRAGGGLSAAALSSVVADSNLYLPFLAVAACCAAIVIFAIRPQRGLL